MKKKAPIIIIAVLVICGIAAGVTTYYLNNKKSNDTAISQTTSTSVTTSTDQKTITLDIIADGKTVTKSITTSADMLGTALVDEKIVNEDRGDYGLYIQTVNIPDGNPRTADSSKEEWWCITKGNATVSTGADSTEIVNGDHFEITLKTGY